MRIPPSLQANPRLSNWVNFDQPGAVHIKFGKVEYGQGSSTGLLQIGAEELDVDLARVRWSEPSTLTAPDEGLTAGSTTIELSGQAVRHACAQVRALFIQQCAALIDCADDELTVGDGAILRDGIPTGYDYWSLADQVDLDVEPSENVVLKHPVKYTIVGTSAPRVDLAAKVFGGTFLHDLLPPGVIHARVLRQPGRSARLISIDETRIRKAARTDVDIVRDRNFVAVLSRDESAAQRALNAALETSRWEGVHEFESAYGDAASLTLLESTVLTNGAPPAAPSNRKQISATYSKPYWSHGSLGPSCSLAELRGKQLSVWSHARGVFPLRKLIADTTGHPLENINVIHRQGPGVYGRNGSDDAAVDAAVIALRRPGSLVRVLWRREDEFAYAPAGSAMVIKLTAQLDDDGRIADFTNEIWSGPYTGQNTSLAMAALSPGASQASKHDPISGRVPPGYGLALTPGSLNATPDYDIEAMRVIDHQVQTPVRTGALRTLGGGPNEFAVECFIDECAAAAQADPVEYRLAMLKDPRGARVVQRCAELSGWRDKRGPAGTGKGIGIGYSLHRNRAGYIAVVAQVDVDFDVRLRQVWCVADCGLIVNPDGARDQLEGGIVMGASWALKEQLTFDECGLASGSWEEYPILRFDEVPPILVELVTESRDPSVGTGEASSGPAMAAIGNAVAHALGARVRDLPLTRERIADAMLSV